MSNIETDLDRLSSLAQKPHVLVVDDEPLNRALLHDMLEARGYDILEADDGPQALLDDSRLPDRACLVIDYRMPELDGIEVTVAPTSGF